jgi:Zn finger protein HypA/HybF involved in hydrogenase expression
MTDEKQDTKDAIEEAYPVETAASEVEVEHIDVRCGNCERAFSFPIEPKVTSFSFDCTNCGAHNNWVRQQ